MIYIFFNLFYRWENVRLDLYIFEYLFINKIFEMKNISLKCNIIHETGSCHFDMTHFFRPVLTYINN